MPKKKNTKNKITKNINKKRKLTKKNNKKITKKKIKKTNKNKIKQKGGYGTSGDIGNLITSIINVAKYTINSVTSSISLINYTRNIKSNLNQPYAPNEYNAPGNF